MFLVLPVTPDKILLHHDQIILSGPSAGIFSWLISISIFVIAIVAGLFFVIMPFTRIGVPNDLFSMIAFVMPTGFGFFLLVSVILNFWHFESLIISTSGIVHKERFYFYVKERSYPPQDCAIYFEAIPLVNKSSLTKSGRSYRFKMYLRLGENKRKLFEYGLTLYQKYNELAQAIHNFGIAITSPMIDLAKL